MLIEGGQKREMFVLSLQSRDVSSPPGSVSVSPLRGKDDAVTPPPSHKCAVKLAQAVCTVWVTLHIF